MKANCKHYGHEDNCSSYIHQHTNYSSVDMKLNNEASYVNAMSIFSDVFCTATRAG